MVLCAFDLFELEGHDMRRVAIEERKAALAKLLRRSRDGIAYNRHYTEDGATIYKVACSLGCEGIVSKRLGSPYRAGRADCWIKVKNRGSASSDARGRGRLEQVTLGLLPAAAQHLD